MEPPSPELVPLANFADEYLVTNLRLPLEVADQLALDRKAIHDIMVSAGMWRLTIFDTDQTDTPECTGINEDGTGISSKAGFNNQAENKIHAPYKPNNHLKCGQWQIISFELPRTEITSTVSRMEPGGIRNVENWRSTLEKEMRKHLLKRSLPFLLTPRIRESLAVLIPTMIGVAANLSASDIIDHAADMPFLVAGYSALISISKTPSRISLYPIFGMEVDLAALTILRIQTRQLVYTVTPEE